MTKTLRLNYFVFANARGERILREHFPGARVIRGDETGRCFVSSSDIDGEVWVQCHPRYAGIGMLTSQFLAGRLSSGLR